jgi:hypothetical protein
VSGLTLNWISTFVPTVTQTMEAKGHAKTIATLLSKPLDFCLTKLLGRENACNREAMPIRKSSYRDLRKSIWDVYVVIFFRHLQNLFWKSNGSERIWRTILAPLLGTASTTYRDATAHDVPYPELICQAMMFLA